MRILIINFEYPPLGGGGGVATKEIAEELAKRHQVHVLTSKHQGLVSEEKINDVLVHRVWTLPRRELATATLWSMISFVPAAFLVGLRILKENKFDVINAQFVVPSGIPGSWLAKIFKIPFVLSFVGGDLFDPSKGVSPHRHPVLRAVIRQVARSAKAMTAISEDTKKRAIELHDVDGEIVVTHLGVKQHDIPDISKPDLGLPQDSKIFVSIGRLIARKGYKTLLQAWQNVPNAHLVIIGQGFLKDELKQQALELGIQDRVHFVGFISEDQKLKYLAAADGYISAAEHEGFGIVFLEAMQAGLPIIAANEGGHTDFLTDQENALLVQAGDTEGFASAVQRIISDDSLAAAMGRGNRERVKDFYLEKTVALFEDVLKKAHESRI